MSLFILFKDIRDLNCKRATQYWYEKKPTIIHDMDVRSEMCASRVSEFGFYTLSPVGQRHCSTLTFTKMIAYYNLRHTFYGKCCFFLPGKLNSSPNKTKFSCLSFWSMFCPFNALIFFLKITRESVRTFKSNKTHFICICFETFF